MFKQGSNWFRRMFKQDVFQFEVQSGYDGCLNRVFSNLKRSDYDGVRRFRLGIKEGKEQLFKQAA
jgi:hypothetical protein